MTFSPRFRVAITGIGLITPVGNDTQSTWQSIIQGKSGIGLIDDRVKMPVDCPYQIVGQVKNEQSVINHVISEKNQSRADRFIQLGLVAGHEAMMSAGLAQAFPVERTRFGCYVGVGMGGLGDLTESVLMLEREGYKRISPLTIPRVISNEVASWLAMQWNLQGPMTVITNACASSGDAVGLSFRLIRDGYCDYMLTGGAEACLVPIGIVSFGNMRALSSWQGDPAYASRPFDAGRSGFVIAEGAAMLVLERYDLAVARGAKIYAEIIGYGSAADAYHITAMHPDGRGALKALSNAIEDARINPEQIGYVNAHGTGTTMNDVVETVALKKFFGETIKPSLQNHIMVSSTKSMTGHMLGAAGAAEAAFSAMALQNQLFPPTINLDTPDPLCDLDYIPCVARSAQVTFAISNSFGFGGGNAVLVLQRA